MDEKTQETTSESETQEASTANEVANESETQARSTVTAPQQSTQGSVDLSGLATEIQALPERIANAVREAVTPPKAPKPREEPKKEAAKEEPKKEEEKVPGEPNKTIRGNSFGEWWFGR